MSVVCFISNSIDAIQRLVDNAIHKPCVVRAVARFLEPNIRKGAVSVHGVHADENRKPNVITWRPPA